MKKWLQYAFLLGLLGFLALGLVRTVFFPKEINSYENRYAEKIAPFTLTGFAEGSFQQSVEDALSDQVPLSQTFKKVYNLYTSHFIKAASRPILGLLPDKYVVLGDKLLFGGENIMFWTRTLESQTERLDTKAANYNAVFAHHPDVDFYLYFIEKDTDINFETGYRVEAFDHLINKLDLPAENAACFRIDSFDQFKSWFFRTDHHWNAAGSLEGYRQVLSLLKPDETPLAPTEQVTLKETLTGSKATGALAAFSEEMTVYRYPYPEMTVTVNGAPAEDYGNQEAYLSGEGGTPTYGRFYGSDNGETTFDTGTQGRGNLLVVGESFDNAILKLLAAHYDRTFSVDLRYYEAQMGIPFDLDAYLAEHAIDTVLLIGNIDYFVMEEFLLGGAEHGIQ